MGLGSLLGPLPTQVLSAKAPVNPSVILHAMTLTQAGPPGTTLSLLGPPLAPPVPTDGTPLSELSWSSSLAVVAVSFSGLFTFIFLMLACLCCKKGDIGFKVSWGSGDQGHGWNGSLPRLGCPGAWLGKVFL